MKRKGEAADRLIGRMVNTGATSSQLNRKGAALARVAQISKGIGATATTSSC